MHANALQFAFSAKEEDFSWITEQSADISNDFLLAQHLQHQFDQEHDQLLKIEEDKFNGPSKGICFCFYLGSEVVVWFCFVLYVLLLPLFWDMGVSKITISRAPRDSEK